MYVRYRHRRGPYALARSRSPIRTIIRLVLLAILLYVFYSVGATIVGFFSDGLVSVPVQVQVGGDQLTLRDSEGATVTLSGSQIAPGITVTAVQAGSELVLADRTTVRLDTNAELTIVRNERSKSTTRTELALLHGRVFVWRTTDLDASSMSTITTPRMQLQFPTGAATLVGLSSVMVTQATGKGVSVSVPEVGGSIDIGIGQQLLLPMSMNATSLEQVRSALPASVQLDPLLTTADAVTVGGGTTTTAPALNDVHRLTLTAPNDGITVASATVRVSGIAPDGIERLRVNGYDVKANQGDRTFSLELSLPDQKDITITAQAIDSHGVSVDEVRRTIHRSLSGAQIVTITEPGKGGDTYRTLADEVVLRGTAPEGTMRIRVNDYQLTQYTPGKRTWSYVASGTIGNLKRGKNVFVVTAFDAKDAAFPPAMITILWEEGPSGIVSTPSVPPATTTVTSEGTLPTNTPLAPGTITITGPSTDGTFTGSGEFLLEGTTSPSTDSIWINGYRLQKYVPGNRTWNYYASPTYNTLKPGRNVYRIVARDAAGKILDVKEFMGFMR